MVFVSPLIGILFILLKTLIISLLWILRVLMISLMLLFTSHTLLETLVSAWAAIEGCRQTLVRRNSEIENPTIYNPHWQCENRHLWTAQCLYSNTRYWRGGSTRRKGVNDKMRKRKGVEPKGQNGVIWRSSNEMKEMFRKGKVLRETVPPTPLRNLKKNWEWKSAAGGLKELKSSHGENVCNARESWKWRKTSVRIEHDLNCLNSPFIKPIVKPKNVPKISKIWKKFVNNFSNI